MINNNYFSDVGYGIISYGGINCDPINYNSINIDKIHHPFSEPPSPKYYCSYIFSKRRKMYSGKVELTKLDYEKVTLIATGHRKSKLSYIRVNNYYGNFKFGKTIAFISKESSTKIMKFIRRRLDKLMLQGEKKW